LDTQTERSQQSWLRGVNALLPASITVRWSKPVSDTFHARHAAISRTYIYVLRNDPVRSPFMAGRAGWVFRPLDLSLMRQAAAHLVGEHDFSCFRSSQCQAPHPVRTIHDV